MWYNQQLKNNQNNKINAYTSVKIAVIWDIFSCAKLFEVQVIEKKTKTTGFKYFKVTG